MLVHDLTHCYDKEFTPQFLYLKTVQFYGSGEFLDAITFV